MKYIYFVRHAEYANPRKILHGRLPLRLTAAGRREAKELGIWFKDKGVTKVFSSPVERTQETAAIIARTLKKKVQTDRRLIEVDNPAQGMLLKEYEKLPYQYEWSPKLAGETQRDVADRMAAFVIEKIKKERGNIIAVSHGDPIHFLRFALQGKQLPKNFKQYRAEPFPQLGSVTVISVQDDSAQLTDTIDLVP